LILKQPREALLSMAGILSGTGAKQWEKPKNQHQRMIESANLGFRWKIPCVLLALTVFMEIVILRFSLQVLVF